MTLKVNEIFFSLQGESIDIGSPCIFVRLTGCNLRCSYCDTKSAYNEGSDISIEDLITKIKNLNKDCRLVEITGGEPLLQKDIFNFINILCDDGYRVLIETNGAAPIKQVDRRAVIIMDMKCPSSGHEKDFLKENLDYLKKNIDQIKFVISDKKDFLWAQKQVKLYDLDKKAIVLFSGVHKKIDTSLLAEWILKSNINVRLQVQLHKLLNFK